MLSPNPVYSDLLQNNNFYKWQPIGRAFLINTKDFEIQKNILKFFILRKSIPTDEGDGKFLNIAAASIIAKTFRDDIMQSIGKDFPNYCWHQNKGYPTKQHKEAINQFGLSNIHRKSFKI